MATQQHLTLAQITALVKLAKRVEQFNNLTPAKVPQAAKAPTATGTSILSASVCTAPRLKQVGRVNPLPSAPKAWMEHHVPPP